MHALINSKVPSIFALPIGDPIIFQESTNFSFGPANTTPRDAPIDCIYVNRNHGTH
jgi:hypothetical protein